MIKKLRRKLIVFSMVLLTLVLTGIMFFAYYSFSAGLRDSSMQTLQAAADILDRSHRPGDPDAGGVGQCFMLERDKSGNLNAVGPSQFDLSDEAALQALLEKAESFDSRTGDLTQEELRFLRIDAGPGTKYVFMDISGEMHAAAQLFWAYLSIYVAGLAVFFFISVLLAQWAVRPVEKTWEQQRQFVADASHELKTPLTVILTNAELLADSGKDKDPFSGNILTMSQQMRGLVDELLEQARVDDDQLPPTHTTLDMSKLVSDAFLPFEPVYYEAGRKLIGEIDPEITLSGNAGQLQRVVEILLDNGCKYSAPGSTVVLRLTRRNRHCLLAVTSPGEELTAQQRTNIFKRFYRLDTARTMTKSYGLGLSIANSIVEQHKGRIWAHSADGQNTFYVLLPL